MRAWDPHMGHIDRERGTRLFELIQRRSTKVIYEFIYVKVSAVRNYLSVDESYWLECMINGYIDYIKYTDYNYLNWNWIYLLARNIYVYCSILQDKTQLNNWWNLCVHFFYGTIEDPKMVNYQLTFTTTVLFIIIPLLTRRASMHQHRSPQYIHKSCVFENKYTSANT